MIFSSSGDPSTVCLINFILSENESLLLLKHIRNECMMCLFHCISQSVWFTWLIELQNKSESFIMMPPASTLITPCHTTDLCFCLLSLSLLWMVTEEHILWRGCHYYDYGYNEMTCSNNSEGISFAHLLLSQADAWRRKRLALTWHC